MVGTVRRVLVIHILLCMALIAAPGPLLMNNSTVSAQNRKGSKPVPKKQAAKVRSEAALKADELFWQTFHNGEYEKI